MPSDLQLFSRSPRPKPSIDAVAPYEASVIGTAALPPPAAVGRALFTEVLRNRRTAYGDRRLTVLEVSTLLSYAASTTAVLAEHPLHLEQRPSPAGGAIHCLEIFVQDADGLEDGLHWYRPHNNSISLVAGSTSVAAELREMARECLELGPATLVWFGADAAVKAAKYSHPNTLILRDAGALMQTFCLTAHAMNLQSAALGILGTEALSTIRGSRQLWGAGGLSVSQSHGVAA